MLATKVSGAWKTVQYVYVKVSGSWKTVGQIYVKANGSWNPIWSYSWSSGSWGSCSADCGGGTQTRTVTCSRNDGQTVTDSICTAMVGTKPSTSQSCNTDDCTHEYCSDSDCYWRWSGVTSEGVSSSTWIVSWTADTIIGEAGSLMYMCFNGTCTEYVNSGIDYSNAYDFGGYLIYTASTGKKYKISPTSGSMTTSSYYACLTIEEM